MDGWIPVNIEVSHFILALRSHNLGEIRVIVFTNVGNWWMVFDFG
jgi:hypothetical protein